MAQKSFKFRLQTILDYKKDMEEKEKEKLAKILAELQRAIEHREYLRQLRIKASWELKEKQKAGGLDIGELRFYTHYLKKLDNDIIEAELMIEEIKAREREQRKALLEAAKERKKYEKVKEKHKEEFEAEMAEKERKLIDELATVKFARRIINQQEAAENGDLEL